MKAYEISFKKDGSYCVLEGIGIDPKKRVLSAVRMEFPVVGVSKQDRIVKDLTIVTDELHTLTDYDLNIVFLAIPPENKSAKTIILIKVETDEDDEFCFPDELFEDGLHAYGDDDDSVGEVDDESQTAIGILRHGCSFYSYVTIGDSCYDISVDSRGKVHVRIDCSD